MVLKSSILACVLAGVAVTQALPMTGSRVNIDKRHKKPLPTVLPAAASLTPDQQYIICLVNTLYNPPKDKDDRLDYEELIDGCSEVVYKPKGAATAAKGDTTDQQGPGAGAGGHTGDSSKPGSDAAAAGFTKQQGPTTIPPLADVGTTAPEGPDGDVTQQGPGIGNPAGMTPPSGATSPAKPAGPAPPTGDKKPTKD
ncbi:unnamed protein product [Absidia cylindrospora]